jgi:trans-aconitate methyltransferase
MSSEAGLPREYFEKLYERRDDPWRFATRWYEQRKRTMTLAVLPRGRYLSVLELGCSTGSITEQLASRSDAVLARADVRDGFPFGSFDLVLVSEVAYSLAQDEVSRLADGIRERLAPSAEVVLCH